MRKQLPRVMEQLAKLGDKLPPRLHHQLEALEACLAQLGILTVCRGGRKSRPITSTSQRRGLALVPSSRAKSS